MQGSGNLGIKCTSSLDRCQLALGGTGILPVLRPARARRQCHPKAITLAEMNHSDGEFCTYIYISFWHIDHKGELGACNPFTFRAVLNAAKLWHSTHRSCWGGCNRRGDVAFQVRVCLIRNDAREIAAMKGRQPVRLLLVAARTAVQAALAEAIRQHRLPYALEIAESPQELSARLRRFDYDVVLLDCTGGDRREPEMLASLKAAPVIALIDGRCQQSALRAVRQGAHPWPVELTDRSSWQLLPVIVECAIACHTRLAGLAHELNQPLTAISNYAQLCGHRLRRCRADGGDEVRDAIEQIAQQAERAREMIGRLREFVRPAQSHRLAADLNELVRNVAALLQVEIRRQGVRLELMLDDSLPTLTVDRIQIEQVIGNLVSNAIEAMRDTPQHARTVTIRTARGAENFLEVSVTDLGRGLPTKDVSRLFEPFYTTKSGGMGLGLSISRSVIAAHGGRLDAAPRPGGGAVFRFTLPVGGEGGKRGGKGGEK